MIKTTYKYTKDKNLVWNQYTLFDLLRFILSAGLHLYKFTCANKQTFLEEKFGSRRAQTRDLWITSLMRSRLSQAGWYVEWDLNF